MFSQRCQKSYHRDNWLVAAKRSQRRCLLILPCRLFLSLRRRSPRVSDCSPSNRERELGLDRRETGQFCPTDELDTATVIEVSTTNPQKFIRFWNIMPKTMDILEVFGGEHQKSNVFILFLRGLTKSIIYIALVVGLRPTLSLSIYIYIALVGIRPALFS